MRWLVVATGLFLKKNTKISNEQVKLGDAKTAMFRFRYLLLSNLACKHLFCLCAYSLIDLKMKESRVKPQTS